MTKAIELAKKCGAQTEKAHIYGIAFEDEKMLQAFYESAQREQIEKDAKICEQRSDEHAKGKCHSDGIRCSEADYCTEEIRNQLSKEND